MAIDGYFYFDHEDFQCDHEEEAILYGESIKSKIEINVLKSYFYFELILYRFPFPLSLTKLIGDLFDNRQHKVNCLVRFSFFSFFCLQGLEKNDIRISRMIGQLE